MKLLKLFCIAVFAASSAAASAAPFDFDGAGDNHAGAYYYAITGGLFPTGNAPNGDNASGGTFRYIYDDPYWGGAGQQWHKDDWFPENAGLALTMRSGGSAVYDNNGIEDGSYGDFYDAQAQGSVNAETPGLYRGFSNPNNYDWIYATYFEVETSIVIDEIIGYFDANGSDSSPFDPSVSDYQMNIWSSFQDIPQANADSWMPVDTGSFLGDVMTSEITGSAYVGGDFSYSDTDVDRVFSDGATDDIYRLRYTLDAPMTLDAGVYFFSHSAVVPAVVPAPLTVSLLALGLAVVGFDRSKTRS